MTKSFEKRQSTLNKRSKKRIAIGGFSLCLACFICGCVGTDQEELSSKGRCSDQEELLNFVLTTDGYGGETSWELFDTSTNTLIMEGPGQNTEYTSWKKIRIKKCLPPGTYELTIYDSEDDGICCRYGRGSYKVRLDGKLIQSGGEFNGEETISFTVSGPDDDPDDNDDPNDNDDPDDNDDPNNGGLADIISQPPNNGNLPMVDINLFIGQTFVDAIENSWQDFFDKMTDHLRSLGYHPNWIIYGNALDDRGQNSPFSRIGAGSLSNLRENFKNEAARLGVSSGVRAYVSSTSDSGGTKGQAGGCMGVSVTVSGPNLRGQQLVNHSNILAHEIAHTLGLGKLPADIVEALGKDNPWYHPFWKHLPGDDAAAVYWKQQAENCLSRPGNSYPAQ